jgi:hypothetical protein
MCDNVAVTWSNYESHKTEIETNLRHKIYKEIKETIDKAKLQGISNHFISGLEYAQAKVLGFDISEEKEPYDQSVLFDI